MADRTQIRTYRAADCVVFKKTNEFFGGLSNMAPGFPLVVNGIHIRTSEALYQACRFPHVPDVQRLIIDQRSPMTAKMRSKPYRKKSRPDWNQVRVNIMRWCLRVKLAQNWQKFSNLLLATDDRPIVEESGKDDFWGAKPLENGTLVGQNVLGRLLMELREELRGPGKERLKSISPPEIPNLLLFGEPIRSLDEGDHVVMVERDLFTEPKESASKKEPEKGICRGKMIPKECKRLAEVDFPIAVVSKHSAREKSIRHGHPSTLHLWWARRPLAACRAMLMALLLPDPCDARCPEEFRTKARELLLEMPGWNTPRMNQHVKSDEGLRKAILTFIGDFANWDNAANRDFLATARGLVKAAHPEEMPLVVDPFAGGGSIPLEALRIGCEAFASDLNPVACLILKVMLEDIPRWGRKKVKVKRQNGKEIEADGLAEALRIIGKDIKEQAEKELAEFYPDDPDGAKPIAYLWARTVRCESPNCGAEIPLMRSFWLCKKAKRKRALRYKVKRQKEKGKSPEVEFEIFEPKSDKEVPSGTVTRAKATCPCCGAVLPPERVRAQLAEQRGGADAVFKEKGKSKNAKSEGEKAKVEVERVGGARLLAVVTLKPDEQGRHYRLPTDRDYQAVWKAQERIKEILDEWERGGKKGLCPVPNEPLPPIGTLGFRVQRYGMLQWGDLFTARQKVGLLALTNKTKNADDSTLKTLIALLIGKGADGNSSLCRWMADSENPVNQFSRQALPIVWDFCESSPASQARGVFLSATNSVAEVIRQVRAANIGQVQQADACESPLPSDTVGTWFTDPPYYDAIPYSDLSDFFLTWMRRTLPDNPSLRDPFDPKNPLSPKSREAVQDETRVVNGRSKDRIFFEEVMARSFAEGRRILKEDGIGSVVFAHKTTEGWEALLTGLIKGGWTITGSWPIATESPSRLRARESAALATSVHLVCRPRPDDAPVGDWADVLRELPNRVGDWMGRLQGEGIRGADLVFACIGPALEIFSRYRKVETAEGREVTLAEYLEKVWEVVGRNALNQILGSEQGKSKKEKGKNENDEDKNEKEEGKSKKEKGKINGAGGALEEDARLTALFLWTLQSTNGEGKSKKEKGKSKNIEEEIDLAENEEDEDAAPRGKPKGYSLVFDVVRRFAQPLGIDLPKWEGRIIETKKGVVRLMAVSERARQLFGTDRFESDIEELLSFSPSGQMVLPGLENVIAKQRRIHRGRGQKISIDDPGEMDASATTLDRVHAAMLLQSGGQANALRALIKAEQDRGPDFLRLANALSALYPKGSEEKRLLDAMLLAVPR